MPIEQNINFKISYNDIIKNNNIHNNILLYLNLPDIIIYSMSSKSLLNNTQTIKDNFIINSIINVKKTTYNKISLNTTSLRQLLYKSNIRLTNIKKENLIIIYNNSLNKKSEFEEDIQKDVYRTKLDNSFKCIKDIRYNSLSNILKAYSSYNSKVGYAQGMNFLVAAIMDLNKSTLEKSNLKNTISNTLSEEECFLILDSFIVKFKLSKIYSNYNNELLNMLNTIKYLIKKFLPKLDKYFDSMYINHEFFTVQWIITLFASSIKKENLYILWDFLLIYNFKFLYFYIVQVLISFENQIIEYDYFNLSFYVKNIMKSDEFEQSFKSIIFKSVDLMRKTSL